MKIIVILIKNKQLKQSKVLIKSIFTISISCLLFSSSVVCQTNTSVCKQFKRISSPEKCWVINHIFVAKKAWRITQYVRLQTDSIQKTNMLDGDANGGQVDAFRHAFWMASLSQKMNW